MQQILEELKSIVKDYDKFCYIAERLAWIDIEEQHERYGTYPLGIILDMYEFPQGYIQDNFVCAYVRACLSGMAFCEEWDRNFWDIPQAERRHCLTKGRMLYEPYATIENIRFIERDWNYLAGEIGYFAREDDVSMMGQIKYMDRFENAEVLELGGDYASDYMYLAIKQNLMLVVSCGYWD